MHASAVPLLACPACRAALTLQPGERASDGHIMTGALRCAACRRDYPIAGGIPRLVAGAPPESEETAARFGEQWKRFDHMSEYQEDWLKAWLAPVGPADFEGKVVLEGGCGKGRHTITAAGWGPRALIALDLGSAVEVAFAHTRHLPNAHVVQGDIFHPPVGKVFDLAFSVGVLHHLPDPRAGFDALVDRLHPGGRIAIWVYGRENNEWIVRFVNPVREKITARLPHRLLFWLSLAPTGALAAALPLYRSPLASKLPYHAYLEKLASVPLREVHNIVYDQLVTPIAFYLPEDEVRSWFTRLKLKDVQLAWHNENSWRGTATV
jgi:SAM-dependent methyltransferase